MNPHDKKPARASNLPPQPKPANSARQLRTPLGARPPRAAAPPALKQLSRLKAAPDSPSRPQSAQHKTKGALQAKTSPLAPPVYRPQPLQKVLQPKTATKPPSFAGTNRAHVASPPNSPQPQHKRMPLNVGKSQLTRQPSSPAYRAQPARGVLQAKQGVARVPAAFTSRIIQRMVAESRFWHCSNCGAEEVDFAYNHPMPTWDCSTCDGATNWQMGQPPNVGPPPVPVPLVPVVLAPQPFTEQWANARGYSYDKAVSPQVSKKYDKTIGNAGGAHKPKGRILVHDSGDYAISVDQDEHAGQAWKAHYRVGNAWAYAGTYSGTLNKLPRAVGNGPQSLP